MQARRTFFFEEGQAVSRVLIGNHVPGDNTLTLPCGKCLGCRTAAARAWAIRCQLELQQHSNAAFVTLTYDAKHLPPTLQKRDLQLWLKRLRKSSRQNSAQPLRFFGCGEYGETNKRPHYHAIIYGLKPADKQLVADTWAQGRTQVDHATARAIGYTAGYTNKKIEWNTGEPHERVDLETGEVYTYQPAFTQMSRRPGIAAHVRQFHQSWRRHAIHNGHQVPVPRYLHEAWKQHATPHDMEELEIEKTEEALTRNTQPTDLHAMQLIAEARHAISAAKRKL